MQLINTPDEQCPVGYLTIQTDLGLNYQLAGLVHFQVWRSIR